LAHSTATEEQAYWRDWQNLRDPGAGEQLLQLYIPLVSYHVQRIAVGLPRNVNHDELRSHGMLGLYDALNKFEPGRDLKFDTYASFRIRGAILDGLRREDWLPRSLREKSKKIEVAAEQLEQKYLRTATANEVAGALGLTEDDVTAVQSESFLANVLSIDDNKRDEETGENPGYSMADKKTATPESELLKEETKKDLQKVIEDLSEKEQLVISLFYYEDLTLTEIGKVLNLSTSRISQIHSKALFRLRQVMTKNL
jgi:RNA polymerase sigma factor for flagellar operon FliA